MGGSILFVAVPVSDAAVTIVRRHRAGHPLLHGDRGPARVRPTGRPWLRAPLAAASCIAAEAWLESAVGLVVHLPAVQALAIARAFIRDLRLCLALKFTSPASQTS